jgi:hypothetical protein
MNSLTMNCMIAVAALAVTAGSASAQVLRAEIPFAFRAGNTLMAPGAYDLNMAVSPSRTYFLLRNAETRRSVMLANFNVGDVTKSWKAKRLPTLGFECVDARCALRELWTADDSNAYYFRSPKLGRDGDVHVAEIVMTRLKAD